MDRIEYIAERISATCDLIIEMEKRITRMEILLNLLAERSSVKQLPSSPPILVEVTD